MVFRQLNAMQMKQKETKFDKHFSVFYKKKNLIAVRNYIQLKVLLDKKVKLDLD